MVHCHAWTPELMTAAACGYKSGGGRGRHHHQVATACSWSAVRAESSAVHEISSKRVFNSAGITGAAASLTAKGSFRMMSFCSFTYDITVHRNTGLILSRFYHAIAYQASD
jgi:hypothetical protein